VEGEENADVESPVEEELDVREEEVHVVPLL
jgi:hypothetical protein